MSNNFVIRNFGNAIFVFDPISQRSIFVEGTISNLVPFMINKPNGDIPEDFISTIPESHLTFALSEIKKLKKQINHFLNSEEKSVAENSLGDLHDHSVTQESALKALSNYAIRNEQITNVSIELTYQCNLHCKWCYLDSFNKKGLDRDRLKTLAEQLREQNVVFVLFTGGEVLLRKDVCDIMSDYKKMGFVLEMKSNGLMLSETVIRDIANLQLFNLQISIYGINDGYSQNIRSHYPFRKLVNNIKAAVKQGIPLSVAILVGKHNIDQLSAYQEILSDCGTKEIFYSPYITPRRDGTTHNIDLRLTKKEMEEKFFPFLEKINGFIEPRKYRRRCKGEPVCFAGVDQIAIDPGGTVFPCLDLRLPLGNIMSDSLVQILKKRKDLLSPFRLDKIRKCWNCPLVEYCDSCIGVSMLESGAFNIPSKHKCDITGFYYEAFQKKSGTYEKK